MAIKCVASLGNEPEWAGDGGGGPPKESRTGGGCGGAGGAADGVTRLLIMHLGSLLAPLLLISLSVNLIKRLSTVVRDRAIHSLSAFHSCPLPHPRCILWPDTAGYGN